MHTFKGLQQNQATNDMKRTIFNICYELTAQQEGGSFKPRRELSSETDPAGP